MDDIWIIRINTDPVNLTGSLDLRMILLILSVLRDFFLCSCFRVADFYSETLFLLERFRRIKS